MSDQRTAHLGSVLEGQRRKEREWHAFQQWGVGLRGAGLQLQSHGTAPRRHCITTPACRHIEGSGVFWSLDMVLDQHSHMLRVLA